MRFYLGTCETGWFARTTVPLMVSRRTLARRNPPRALGPWVMDSGAFTELSMYGQWRTTPEQYAHDIDEYADLVGSLEWAAPQDWPCEPFMLERTGHTIAEHQARTTDNVLHMRSLTAHPVIAVLQGWLLDDYLAHVEQYTAAGIDLTREPVVGIGSVCRRQSSVDIGHITTTLESLGISLHGFGVKSAGIARYAHTLTSADSMAWSYRGRRIQPCPHDGRRSCAHCLAHALEWRTRVLDAAVGPRQLELVI